MNRTTSYFRNLLMPNLRFIVADGDAPPPAFNADSFRNTGEIGPENTPPPPKDDNTPPPKDTTPPPPKDTTPPPPKDTTPPPPAGDYKPADLWDVMKEELSTKDKPWELPEPLKTGKKNDGTPLTKKEELALMRETISQNTKFDDDFINEYVAAKESGMPVQDFVKSKAKNLDFASLGTDDKVRLYYEDYSKANKLEWTKEDIDAKINGLTKVDKDMQAKAYESYLGNKQSEEVKQYVNTQNSTFETKYTKAETENTQIITNYLKEIEGKNTVSGIEFSEAEMTQFKKDLPTFMKREIKSDPKTGLKYAVSPAEELLSEILAKPEDTFDLLPYLYMVKNKSLKGYSQRLKETIKKSLEGTLDNQPENMGSRNSTSGFDSKSFRDSK